MPSDSYTLIISDAGVSTPSAGSVTNASVASDAAIAFSKLATLTSGNIIVGNGSNVPTSVALSGNVTLSNTGVATIANDAVTFGKMQNVSGYSILGKPTSDTGDVTEITSSAFMLQSSTGLLRQSDATSARSTLGLVDAATGNALLSGGVGSPPSYGKVGLTTHVSGTLPAANGGTGQSSYAIGDITYANSSTTLAKLADIATGNALLSGGVGLAPAYGKVGLTTHVSGTLPAANGGTGQTSYTIGDIPYASGATALSKLADVATGNVLLSGGIGIAPAYGKVGLTTHISGTLATTNGGTGQSSYAIGDIVYASDVTTLSSLSAVESGNVLISDGVDTAPIYGKVELTTHVDGILPVENGGTNQVSVVRGQISRMTAFTAVTVSVTGTYYPLTNAGTLDTGVNSNMSLGADSTFSIKNTSDVTRVFRVYASVDATASNNDVLGIKLFKGTAGSLAAVNETECRAFTSSSSSAAKLVTSWMVSLAANQEIAVYVANHTAASNITAQRARLIAEAVI